MTWKVHDVCIVHMHCGMPKGTCQAEAASSNIKLKPIALAIIELCAACLKVLVSKQVSQPAEEISLNIKFHSNLLEMFWVTLKALLDLFIPHQYCQRAVIVL